jgi:alpha-glucosidase
VWVQDWIGGRNWTPTIYDLTYRWVADDALYPDLAALVAELRADHDVRFLAYANPFVIRDLDHFDEMEAMGMLPRREDGSTYDFSVVFSQGSVADLTNPAAVDYIQGFLSSAVTELGFDGWMADFGEWLPTDAVLSSGEDARLVHNLYPALWHRTSREVMEEERPDGDWVIFTRSGWLRDHAEAQVVWIGDQEADFLPGDGLPTVVPAMLNLGLSGIPFVTHDIAGYSGGPSDRELFMRWTELGAFTPIFRTHEGLKAAENWSWDRDAETTAHFRRFARVHEALKPELLRLAEEAAATSMPIVRHLAMVFPDDAGSRAISDQLMLGDDLLVAPVVTEGATRREVYLPPGAWFHVFTGERFEGPGTVTVEAPLGTPPVFSRGEDRTDLRAIE